jgi:hypothetical protein
MNFHFPVIQTNVWDAFIAVPVVFILTQVIKIFLKVPKKYVPAVAVIIGLLFSVFISHRHHLIEGIFMGWFYGYAAVGSYASLKTTLLSIRNNQ